MEKPELRDQANVTLASAPKDNGIDGREMIKIEFYKTYDVMTGIRIAATLGGFFSMMILLVLYKNYCKPSKTLSEEQLNAAVSAAVEEEDRALKAALEATSFYTSLSKQRVSITNEGSEAFSPRFSSVGGGCSHLAPPLRLSYLQQRGKSLPGSALRFSTEDGHMKLSKCTAGENEEEEDFDAECQPPDYFSGGNYLTVPPDRRLSSITCSSADTSYLERRGSAFEMGLPAPPCFPRSEVDKQKLDEEGPWDFYYPIDIQVIQPTPEISPAVSEETLHESNAGRCGLQVPGFHDRVHRLSTDSTESGIAPLASISSIAGFSSSAATVTPQPLFPEEASKGNEDSVGSDSVFLEDADTEDEVEEFSTDSELDYDGFDDDYSFCEGSKTAAGRCRKRSLRFASFDSYDASIGRDEEDGDEAEDKMVRQPVQPQEVTRVKRKLGKTHSEPRGQKAKQLPIWIDKGRSGYVPKRQMSVPATRRKQREGNDQRGETRDEEEKPRADPLPVEHSSREGYCDPKCIRKDQSSAKSLQEDRRKRLQKQKTVNEEWIPPPEEVSPTNSNLLLLPQITVDTGSCERLNILPGEDRGVPRSTEHSH